MKDIFTHSSHSNIISGLNRLHAGERQRGESEGACTG